MKKSPKHFEEKTEPVGYHSGGIGKNIMRGDHTKPRLPPQNMQKKNANKNIQKIAFMKTKTSFQPAHLMKNRTGKRLILIEMA